MSDGIASAALARVSALLGAAVGALGVSIFFGGTVLRIAGLALAVGALIFTIITKPIDEEAAPAHRKKQVVFGLASLGLILLTVAWLL